MLPFALPDGAPISFTPAAGLLYTATFDNDLIAPPTVTVNRLLGYAVVHHTEHDGQPTTRITPVTDHPYGPQTYRLISPKSTTYRIAHVRPWTTQPSDKTLTDRKATAARDWARWWPNEIGTAAETAATPASFLTAAHDALDEAWEARALSLQPSTLDDAA